MIYPDSVSLVNPPTTTIPNTSPAVPRSQYPTERGGTISWISRGAALEKYFALRRRGRVDDHCTRHWREGRKGRGFRMGRLKWKKDVGIGEGRNALSRGRIMFVTEINDDRFGSKLPVDLSAKRFLHNTSYLHFQESQDEFSLTDAKSTDFHFLVELKSNLSITQLASGVRVLLEQLCKMSQG